MSGPQGHRSIRPVQLAWLLLAVTLTTGCAVILVSQWHTLGTPCTTADTCGPTQLSESSARLLSEHNIPMSTFATYIEIVLVFTWCVWYGIGVLIISRKPDERGAVVAAFFLILFPEVLGSALLPASTSHVLIGLLAAPGLFALLLFCLLFPDGWFRPSWTRWLAVAAVPATVLVVASFATVAEVPWLLILLAVVAAQVYRYRRFSSWAQRQQTKWGLFGLVVALVGFTAMTICYAFPWGANGTLYAGFSTSIATVVATCIPVSIGIAMLRSRLWDIDHVINRVLVYAVLSSTLVVIYTGSVLVLESVIRDVTGQSSGIAVALSTLLVAFLFNPLRFRIQAVIARAFYRKRYDAAKILNAFGARCRDETDLEQLRSDLVGVVDETMQPGHVSLWLARAFPQVAP